MAITAALVGLALTGCGSSSNSEKLAVQINAPTDGSTVVNNRLTVRGTVAPGDALVQVMGQPAQVSNGVFSSSVRLHMGDNRIDVVATKEGASPATTAITVTHPHAGQGKTQSGTSTPSTQTPTPTPSPTPQASTRSCGDGITANSVTSCPFAIRVRDAYTAQGGPNITVYSPVTEQVYDMTCTTGPGAQVTCRGGNNAVVTF